MTPSSPPAPEPLFFMTRHLLASAHMAIRHGLNEAWRRTSPHAPQEPDLVAALVMEGMNVLASHWRYLFQLSGMTFSCTSVFCHQSPMLEFKGIRKKSIEIGDLLIVYIHTPSKGRPLRRALLLQAKTSSKTKTPVRTSDLDQLALYAGWPKFRYVRGIPHLLGKERDVQPKVAHTGAQYLLIDSRPPTNPISGLQSAPGTYPAGLSWAIDPLDIYTDLGAALVRMLFGYTGRYFHSLTSSTQDDWSKVVWDLLRVGMKNAFNRKRSRYHDVRRHSGSPAGFDGMAYLSWEPDTTSDLVASLLGSDRARYLQDGGEDIPPFNDNIERDDGGGISLILLETGTSNESKEWPELFTLLL